MELMSASDNFALLEPTAELMSPTAPVFRGKEYEYLSAPFTIWYTFDHDAAPATEIPEHEPPEGSEP